MKRCIDCDVEISQFSMRCKPCAKLKNKDRSIERKRREQAAKVAREKNPPKPSDGCPWPATTEM